MRTAWGWSCAAGGGAVVEVGGPGVGVAGVAGEVGDGVAQLLVAGPAEADGADLAGLAGGGGDAGEAGQGLRGWGSGRGSRRSRRAGGRRGRVPERGRRVKMCASACAASCSSIWSDRALICSTRVRQHARAARGDVGLGGAVGAGERRAVRRPGGRAGRRGRCGRSSPLVSQAARRWGESQSARSWRVEAGQERQADRAVDVGEQADRAGERVPQVRAQLVGQRDAVGDQVLAGAAGRGAASRWPGCPGSAGAAGPGRCAACRPARTRRTGRPCCRPSRSGRAGS